MGTGHRAPKATNSGGANALANIPEAPAQATTVVPLAPVQSARQVPVPLPARHTSIDASRQTTAKSNPLAQIVPFADPFVGFVGHCFLHFCQAMEFVTGWTEPRSAHAEMAAESLLNSSTHPGPLKQWGACSLGTICCSVVAACLIPLFSESSIKSFLPIPFLLIIALVAFRFGRGAGVLGTIASALLFAGFLFEPSGLAVGDPVAKRHLIWMLVIGIVFSDLLARFKLRWESHRV
jgi:Domain of unknown function (DUF4118)